MKTRSSETDAPPLSRVFEYLRTLGYNHVSGTVPVRTGSRTLHADAVAYESSSYATPLIVVEHKEEFSERPTLLDASVQQAFALATLLGPSVRYLLISSGNRHVWFERNPASQSLTLLETAPTANDSAGLARAEAMGLAPVLGSDDLTRLIQELIGVLRTESLVFGLPMAIEVNRILIAKLQDERSTATGGTFRFRHQGNPRDTAERLRQLYEESIYGAQTTGVLRDLWTISPETLAKAVVILEPYHLGSVRSEVLGEWFWRLLPPLLPRDQAQHFTPAPIGRVMAELAGTSARDRVIDPACGAGLLLLEANRHVRTQSTDGSELASFQREIAGIDLNAEVAELAATNLILAGLSPNRIINADALSRDSLEGAGVQPGTFDVVLLDPPLGRPATRLMGHTGRELAHRSSATLESLFLEQAVNLLRSGGRLAILVPDSLLSSPSQLPTRRRIMAHAVPRAIISLPPEAFGPVGHSGKASILLLEKNAERADQKVFVADVTAVGYDRFGNPLPANDLPSVVSLYKQFRATGSLPSEASRSSLRAWVTPLEDVSAERLDILRLDPEEHDLTYSLRHGSHPTAKLGDVAEIVSGKNFKNYVEKTLDSPQVIQAGGVREFHLDVASAPNISPEEYARSGRSQIREGDVLVTTTGLYLGRASVVEALHHAAVASGAVTILRPASGLDPAFLAAFLNSRLGRHQVASRQAAATAQPYIRRSDLGKILIPLPPLDLQQELGQRAHAMHREALELRRRAEEIEQQARDLVAAELLGRDGDE